MPISMKSRVYRALLKRVVKELDLTLEDIRRPAGLSTVPPLLLPRGVGIHPVDAGGVPAEWLVPEGALEGAVVLHLHGGGYVSGSAELDRMLTAQLAKSAGARVLAPNYRLAPEHPFPAALEDALAVYRFLLAEGYPPEGIALSGDSAGGGLAMALIMSLRDASEPLPAALVCMSPWADLELKNRSCATKQQDEAVLKVGDLREWARQYAGGRPLDSAGLSPVNGDFSGFPPTLIQVGSEEVLLDDALIVTRKASAAGATVELSVWEGLWHCWQVLGRFVPENAESFAEVERFLRSRLG